MLISHQIFSVAKHYLGLNIYLVPIFVVFIQFGHHFRFVFD